MNGFNPLRMEIARVENLGSRSVAYLDDILCNVHRWRGGDLSDSFVFVSIQKPLYVNCGDYCILNWDGYQGQVLIEETRIDPRGAMDVICRITIFGEALRRRNLQLIKDHESPSYSENN